MQFSTTVIGLILLVGCLVAFFVVLPRGGRASPLLRSGGVESGFVMVWVTVLLIGAALALFGAPAGSPIGR